MTNKIFVFGSNLAGRHGKGAALYARQHHDAIYGQGFGRQGMSYAIPTKNSQLKSLPIWVINSYIEEFITYTRLHPELTFELTRIGCGLAGYTDEEIAPMFKHAPTNVLKPTGW